MSYGTNPADTYRQRELRYFAFVRHTQAGRGQN